MYDKSKHAKYLCFDEPAPGKAAYFEHDFGSYKLEARILYNKKHEEPWVISIHGARGDFTKANGILFELQNSGYSILGMNLSGHSPASGVEPGKTSLAANIHEAEVFFSRLNPTRKKIVLGFSMGATSALSLLRNHAKEIEKLILFYPAVYDVAAYNKPFGDEFRAAISKPFSYRNNDTLELLREFSGKVMLIMGEFDGLDSSAYGKPVGGSVGTIELNGRTIYSPIPKEVIDTILKTVPKNNMKYVIVPGCDHSIVPRLALDTSMKNKLFYQIRQFLTS
jgi:hypothetical protein